MKPAEKPAFVVFEGMDGCGKSKISEMFAKQTGAVLLGTPPAEFAEFRGEIDAVYSAHENNGLAAQLFYASTVVHASAAAKKEMKAGRNVAMDRYAASTVVYDTIARQSGFPDEFWLGRVFGGIAVPDAVFYLHASDETRKQRMEERKEKGATDEESIRKAKQLAKRYGKVLASLEEKYSWRVFCVGNETAPEECVNECAKILAQLRS